MNVSTPLAVVFVETLRKNAMLEISKLDGRLWKQMLLFLLK